MRLRGLAVVFGVLPGGMEHHDALNAIAHLRSRKSKARWPEPVPPRDMRRPRLVYVRPESRS